MCVGEMNIYTLLKFVLFTNAYTLYTNYDIVIYNLNRGIRLVKKHSETVSE